MEQKIKVKCDNCRRYIFEDEAYSCVICGAIICYDCVSDDYFDICKDCE